MNTKIALYALGCLLCGTVLAQNTVSVPTREAEDTQHVMSHEYWQVWNDSEQARIDADIDKYRKKNADYKIKSIKKGTTVKVEQITSDFVFGASAFNFNQLGNSKSNKTYRELFGTLFNRATIPFYWKDFEPQPGTPRFAERTIDTEKWWNKAKNPQYQPHWRRPAPEPIVKWCNQHNVAVHGHPLVWGNRKWMVPKWLQTEGIPQAERQILDTLEIIAFASYSIMSPAYSKMSPQEVYNLVPNYIQQMDTRTMQRIEQTMGHYQGRIESWDVVNESAIDYKKGILKPNQPMCKSTYGIMPADYVFRSFAKAAECNKSGALLNINDWDVTQGYIDQVKEMLDRGAKIDVIGSQMHLFNPQECLDIAAGKEIDKGKLVTPQPIREFFSKLGSFGIPTCLSEITITSAGNGKRGEMIQAIITRNLYRMWFSLPSMMGITWWNIVDNCGAPGEPNISGLFQRDMTPKMAYFALDHLLNHEWRTNLELQPDRKGEIHWRGFKGKYRLTWTAKDGSLQEAFIEVKNQ